MLFIALAAAGIVVRLVQLQIVEHDRYASEARNIHVAEETVTGRRGALLDRNGYPLAASKNTYDIMVEVNAWKEINRAEEAAAAIAPLTGGDPAVMVAEVRDASIYEIAVARGLDYESASAIRELGLRGVRLLRSSARVYPEGNLAAQLLGFVGRDNTGLTGLEADLEAVIGGGKGTVVFERDGREWLRPHELNARFTLGLVAAGLVRRGLARLRATLGLEADGRRGFLFALSEPAVGWSDALAALPGESLHIPLASETSRVRPALVFAQDAAALDGLAREVVGLER